MLIITRKVGEAIKIGDDIRVVVSKIRGRNSVRIGIEVGDNNIDIVREELLEND